MLIRIGRETVILAIYRTPAVKNLTNFLNFLDVILTTNSSFRNVIVVRDININIAEGNIDSKAMNYLNLMASHVLLPDHNIPLPVAKLR